MNVMFLRLRRFAVATLVALPLLLAACGEEEDLGFRTGSGSGDGSPVASDASAPTSANTPDPTSTSAIEILPVSTTQKGMPTPGRVGDEETQQEIGDPEFLTIEQAQELVEFTIIVPDAVPDGLHLVGVAVESQQIGEVAESGEQLIALVGFAADPNAEIPDYFVAQSTEPPFPVDRVMSAEMEGESTDFLFGETVVTRLTSSYSCYSFILHTWEQQGLHLAAVAAGIRTPDLGILTEIVGAMTGAEPPADFVGAPPESDEPLANAAGEYCDLTAEQARALAPFPVSIPDETPAPFVLTRIDLVKIVTDGSISNADGTVVPMPTTIPEDNIQLTMWYSVEGSSFEISATVYQGSSMSDFWSDGMGGPDVETRTIEGVEIQRMRMAEPVPAIEPGVTPATGDIDADGPDETWPAMIWYAWSSGETEIMIQATLSPDDANLVSEADVETLIGAIIQSDPATP